MSSFKLIAAEKTNHPIDLLCQVLWSGYYACASRPPSDRALSDAWLTERIREIHTANRRVYGRRACAPNCAWPRTSASVAKRVERLMRQADISGLVPKKKGRTTIRVPGLIRHSDQGSQFVSLTFRTGRGPQQGRPRPR